MKLRSHRAIRCEIEHKKVCRAKGGHIEKMKCVDSMTRLPCAPEWRARKAKWFHACAHGISQGGRRRVSTGTSCCRPGPNEMDTHNSLRTPWPLV